MVLFFLTCILFPRPSSAILDDKCGIYYIEGKAVKSKQGISIKVNEGSESEITFYISSKATSYELIDGFVGVNVMAEVTVDTKCSYSCKASDALLISTLSPHITPIIFNNLTTVPRKVFSCKTDK